VRNKNHFSKLQGAAALGEQPVIDLIKRVVEKTPCVTEGKI
jgi:hypothetical protein